MILIIDNYDSFTQNLVQCIGELGCDIIVLRNDELSLTDVVKLDPSHIILSPGPGNPSNVGGILLNLIYYYAHKIPILGVCLGHQSIGYVYGCNIVQLNEPVHGKISKIFHDQKDIFKNLPSPFLATRYHSLVIDKNYLPSELEITAWTEDGIIMGCRHRQYNLLRGIQFHPESLWTHEGRKIIENFLSNEYLFH
uniref:anthranilate synthase component II n=1 Tax=Hypnea pseudomusciformis TaxID=1545697 RepID=UPI0027DAA278|nr:anthranilate synthase component II [Hypnea pseudomusciformis]WCH55037.1 anthranilate synthase component II [Hypnea pseudomusciformis]WCH55436.1 anthranilate synthase component II [Hypnea pseudomusciformis]WCH56630.1 anthranilate synthase component II [Hypnea pseudomusciformis]